MLYYIRHNAKLPMMIILLPLTSAFRLKTSLKEEENLWENRRESAEMVNDCILVTVKRLLQLDLLPSVIINQWCRCVRALYLCHVVRILLVCDLLRCDTHCQASVHATQIAHNQHIDGTMQAFRDGRTAINRWIIYTIEQNSPLVETSCHCAGRQMS